MPNIPRLVTQSPIAALLFGLFLALPLLALVPKIKTVDNVDYFVVEDDPDVAFYESIKNTFGEDEFFVIAFSNPELFTAPVLQALQNATQNLEAVPGVRKVQSLANINYTHGAEDYFEVRPFLNTIPSSNEGLKTLRDQALSTPLYLENIISPDGQTTAIIVFPDMRAAAEDEGFRKALLNQVKTILSPHQQLLGTFHLAGWTVTNFSLSHFMRADVAVFIPLCYLFVIFTVFIVFRNLRLTAIALANISVSTGAGMGLFVLLDITLNNVTIIVPPLIMALALTDTVHIFAQLDNSLLNKHANPKKAVQSIVENVILPCALCSVTTAVGFMSLAISDIPPIQDFAYVASIGLALKFIFSFLLVPSLILLCRPETVFFTKKNKNNFDSALNWLANFVEKKCTAITICTAILIAGSVWLATGIKVETNLLEFFKPSTQLRQDLNFVEAHLSGVGSLDVSVKAHHIDAFREPSQLRVVEEIQSYANTLPGVGKTMSFVDFLKDMNKSFHNEDPAHHTIPTSQELLSQYLLLYDADDIEDYITPDYDHTRILIRITEHSTSGQARIIRDLQAFIDTLDQRGLEVRLTGRAVQDVNVIDALVWGQVNSLILATFIIIVIMFVALRSFAIGAMSLIPNIFPIVVNFGIMGMLDIPLNTATALISVVALGIAVDDTIHYLTAFQLTRERGLSVTQAVRLVTLEKGTALSATSIILCIGFGVLLFSHFIPTTHFGGLSALTMATAWVGDMVILPAAMIAIAKLRGFRSGRPTG